MSSHTEKIKACIVAPGRTPVEPCINVHVDVSCQPIVNVDVSFNPIINVDISFNPVITVDVSFNPIINVDISFNPVITVDVSFNPTVNVSLDLSGTNNYLATLTNMDAFGRLRVSNPFTLMEFNSITGKNEYFIEENVVGDASSTYFNPDSIVEMTVRGNGSVVRQTREYIMYQPGKSKLIYMTGVLYTDGSIAATGGITCRLGTFDTSSGIFIQMKNGVLSVVERNYGDILDISRGSWTDPLDGTGPSGAVVDFTKAQIFYFQLEWLGVGRVQCGIIQAGRYLPYYTFNHVNSLVKPYIQMAKLPVRYEISGTGTSTNSMRMICGTVISEGGFSPAGKIFTYTNFLDALNPAIVKNILRPHVIWGIRLTNSYPRNRTTLKLKDIQLALSDTTSIIAWQLLLNPTRMSLSVGTETWIPYADTSSGFFDPYKADSSVEIVKPHVTGSNIDTYYNGGHVVASGFCIGKQQISAFLDINELIGQTPAGANILGTPDILMLVGNVPGSAPSGSASPNIYVSAQWTEII
jgi:hypothetical protein